MCTITTAHTCRSVGCRSSSDRSRCGFSSTSGLCAADSGRVLIIVVLVLDDYVDRQRRHCADTEKQQKQEELLQGGVTFATFSLFHGDDEDVGVLCW